MPFSVPAQVTSSLISSIKTISGDTPVDSILAKILDLIRPNGVQREVHHNTVHHIRTIPGPPVTCQPWRLALDQLAIAKAEFDAMLQDATVRRSKSSWSSALYMDILLDSTFCFAYFNFILLSSLSLEEHKQHLWVLFNQLQRHGILINSVKSMFQST
jgi:hypothetical protein